MLGTKIGFDLGSATVLALAEGRGVVVCDPSVIAYDTFTDKIKAIGRDAADMLGRAPDSLTVVRPVKDGIIVDYNAVGHMLSYYIQKICGNRIFKPNVMLCVPTHCSELDRRALLDIAAKSGAARACVVEEPLAAALGAGIAGSEYKGTMVVDIGAGTTDIAIVTKGCISVSMSIDIAGDDFDEGICRFLKRERDIILGEVSAEQIKCQVGAAKFLDAELAVRAIGKDYFTKLPKTTEITSTDVFMCVKEYLDRIAESIKKLLLDAEPELAADVASNGIVLTGGGALLRGIDHYLAEATSLPVRVADNPVECVINGIGVLLDDMKLLEENGYVFKSDQEINDYEE